MFYFRYLYLMSVSILIASSCSANTTQAQKNCDTWYNQTIKQVDDLSASPEKSFRHLLFRLSTACPTIPMELKIAAGDAAKSPADSEFGLYWPLLNVAKPHFPEACDPRLPDTFAAALNAVCLGSDDKRSSILRQIDSSTYLYAKVLEQELHKLELDKKYLKLILYLKFYSAKMWDKKLNRE